MVRYQFESEMEDKTFQNKTKQTPALIFNGDAEKVQF